MYVREKDIKYISQKQNSLENIGLCDPRKVDQCFYASFPPLYSGDDNSSYLLRLLGRLNKLIYVKHLE